MEREFLLGISYLQYRGEGEDSMYMRQETWAWAACFGLVVFFFPSLVPRGYLIPSPFRISRDDKKCRTVKKFR